MHIALDAVGIKYGGTATVLVDLLNAAIDDPRVNKITLFCTTTEKLLFKIPSSGKVIAAPQHWVDKNYALRILWYEWFLGFECKRIEADVLLSSANFGRAGFRIPHVTFIQQSLPFSKEAVASYKSLLKTIKIALIGWQMGRSCWNADSVICQNTIMKNNMTETFCLGASKVRVIYPQPRHFQSAFEDGETIRERKHPSTSGLLLYVGDEYPYKKIDTAIEGVELMRRQFPSTELTMTLPINHHYTSRPGVRCVGYLDDERLAAAYKAADILVLPSLVETVGLPTLEAMSLGTPVLIADRPYAHDVCEDAALFFDPNSPADFAEKAIRLLTDQGLRQTLIDKGLKLVQKRRSEQPYKKIIDIVVECAQKKS